jgi:hypothetical protein
LLQQYAPRKLEDDLLYLKRRPGVEEPLQQYSEPRAVAVGELVEVPPHDRLLMAQIELSRTLLGRLLSIVFKPTAPRIELVLSGGATLDYRLVPGMSAAGSCCHRTSVARRNSCWFRRAAPQWRSTASVHYGCGSTTPAAGCGRAMRASGSPSLPWRRAARRSPG